MEIQVALAMQMLKPDFRTKKEAPTCFYGTDSPATGVNEGIATLRTRFAAASSGFSLIPLGQNGGQCVRLTCSYNVGIWACNDADVGALVTYENIARYAENIRDACGPASNGLWVSGEFCRPELVDYPRVSHGLCYLAD
jgi:hypothetical protein